MDNNNNNCCANKSCRTPVNIANVEAQGPVVDLGCTELKLSHAGALHAMKRVARPPKSGHRDRGAVRIDHPNFTPLDGTVLDRHVQSPVFHDMDGNPSQLNTANVGVNFYVDSKRIMLICGLFIGFAAVVYLTRGSN